MTTSELGRLLEEIAEPVREVDLAERAWHGAQGRRASSRRWVAAAVAASVLLAGGTYAVLNSGDPRTEPVPAQTTVGEGPSWRTATDGTRYVMAPALGTEQTVRWLDLGLPEVIDPDEPRKKLSELLVEEGPDAVIDLRAVHLEAVEDGPWADATQYRPVLVLEGGPLVTVDTAVLRTVADEAGNAHVPLGVRAVSGDHRMLVFPQPGAIVVVDLRTAETKRISVPDEHLEWAGWETGEHLQVIARSADQVWRVDVAGATATRPTEGEGDAAEGAYSFRYDPAGGTPRSLLEWVVGGVRGATVMPWPMVEPWGDTVSSAGVRADGGPPGWIASSFHFDANGKGLDTGLVYQGIAAVPFPLPVQGNPQTLLLAFGEDPSRSKGCCRALGWSDDGRWLLYESGDGPRQFLMAWNVGTGEVRRVTTVAMTDATVPGLALGGTFARN